MTIEEYELKNQERTFWEAASCGERLYLEALTKEGYLKHLQKRYELEPEILTFAQFEKHKGHKVLEIGLGLGADHQKLAEAGTLLFGMDLTNRAVDHTRRRFELLGLPPRLMVADAENPPFSDNTFDLVYSWGVLMCTPDTPKAIREVYRILKPGGLAKIMLYHKYSMVGYMLWLRYAFLGGRPFTPLLDIYMKYLESPGTKAYSVNEVRKLFGDYEIRSINTFLTHGDLLNSEAGQRHEGFFLTVARQIWPRRLIRVLFPRCGLFMTIEAYKPS